MRNIYIEDACRLKIDSNDSPVLLRKIGLGNTNNKGMDWHKNILFENITFKNCTEPYYDIVCTENCEIK